MQFTQFLSHAAATILVVIASGGLGGLIATNGRTDEVLMKPILLAILCVLWAFLPGIVFRAWVFQGANRFLAALAWRFLAGLGALLLAFIWQGAERKIFLGALLTCYFTTLLLESWLELKQAKLSPDK